MCVRLGRALSRPAMQDIQIKTSPCNHAKGLAVNDHTAIKKGSVLREPFSKIFFRIPHFFEWGGCLHK